MKVISGKLRGHLVTKSSIGPNVRPTSEKVRGAIFSSVNSFISLESVRILDLYGGTGAMGIEGISRGAEYACFVETDRNTFLSLQENLNRLGIYSVTKSVCRSAEKFIALGNADRPKYGLVIIDPPYAKHPGVKILELLKENEFLEDGAIIVVESGAKFDMSNQAVEFSLLRNKVYGDTSVWIYRYELSVTSELD